MPMRLDLRPCQPRNGVMRNHTHGGASTMTGHQGSGRDDRDELRSIVARLEAKADEIESRLDMLQKRRSDKVG